jgi:hypothetical protein
MVRRSRPLAGYESNSRWAISDCGASGLGTDRGRSLSNSTVDTGQSKLQSKNPELRKVVGEQLVEPEDPAGVAKKHDKCENDVRLIDARTPR